MAFELEALPYASEALEPHIDRETMEIHHDRHHQAYVDNLNKAIAGTDADGLSLEEINQNISKYPAAVRNNGGGHFNHRLFWSVLGANGGGKPTGELAEAVKEAFGSFAELKTQLQNAGATRFGSGWAWLVVKADGKLAVTSTPGRGRSARNADPGHRRLGTRILSEIPEQASGLFGSRFQRHRLGCRGQTLPRSPVGFSQLRYARSK